MTLKKILFALLALAVIGGVCWWLFHEDEETRVRSRFHVLAEAVGKQAGEANHTTAYKVLTMGGLFAEKVSISIRQFPYNGANTSEELVSLIARGRSMCTSISISVPGMEVAIEGDRASVRCEGRAYITVNSQTYDEKRSFIARLAKVEGKWLFTDFEDDNLLKK
ncbi:MAG: hypothetical protein IJJ33_21450 [Victivallales bacterium]|nr:hypothetical protein [Victivallales bacterium]